MLDNDKKVHESKNYGKFIVLEGVNFYYSWIRFIDTGYERIVDNKQIEDGTVKDKYRKVIFGKACIGSANKKGANKKVYGIWYSIISRCYNKKDKNYKYYGKKGISVSRRWGCFEYFLKDLPKIDGYDVGKFRKGKLHLDKDKKQVDLESKDKVYSLETCTFLKPKEHSKIRKCNQNYYKAVSPKEKEYYFYNKRGFTKEHGLHIGTVDKYMDSGMVINGWKFNKITKEDYNKGKEIER